MLVLGQRSHRDLRTNMINVFCFFSSEKKTFPSNPYLRCPIPTIAIRLVPATNLSADKQRLAIAQDA